MSKPEPSATPAAPAKKPASKLRLLIVGVIVLLAGGGGTYWWMRHQAVAAESPKHATAEEGDAAAHDPHDSSLLPLDTFTVNLADPGVSRFLRVTVQLVLQGADTAATLEHDSLAVTRIRSAVLELLTTQRSDVLVTPEGKTALKTDIGARVSRIAGHEVTDVLFSDFVVQF
jgi:flagellar FliL protein